MTTRPTVAEDYVDLPLVEIPPVADLSYRTVECDGEPVAIFGYSTIGVGLGHCWVSVNTASPKHAVAIVRGGEALIAEAFDLFGIHRLQTTVLACDWRMVRMMALCGFTAESVMHCAAPDGSDMIMFRVIREN